MQFGEILIYVFICNFTVNGKVIVRVIKTPAKMIQITISNCNYPCMITVKVRLFI